MVTLAELAEDQYAGGHSLAKFDRGASEYAKKGTIHPFTIFEVEHEVALAVAHYFFNKLSKRIAV